MTEILTDGLYHIGCSGYYYLYWKDRFYPEGMPSKEWLSYYSMIFDTVELNGTFYHQPRVSTLENYASLVPDDFTFAVKMSKYITHILRLKDAKETVQQFQQLILNGLKDKLASFLFQLPPSFKYSEDNLERVLVSVPDGYENVVEFRDESWWQEESVVKAFKSKGITFCNVDFPKKTTPVIVTSPNFYMRFHGSPELFKSSYSDETLSAFAATLPKSDDYRIYFNNTYYEAGYTNAASLMTNLVT